MLPLWEVTFVLLYDFFACVATASMPYDLSR